MKKTSIKDIALKAGVSLTTVSIVVNGRGKEMNISEAMILKILDLAKEMNYTPNQFAKGLRTGKTNTIGLIVDDISNYFFGNLAKIIEQEADKLGYTVMFCSSENDEGKSRNLLSMLVDKQMDGYIIAPTLSMLPEVEKIIKMNRPIVLIDRFYKDLEANYVIIDNEKASFEGVDYLIKHGHTKIAIVTNDTEQLQMERRLIGYKKSLLENNILFDEKIVKKIPFGINNKKTVKEIKKFLTDLDTKIDAIFFTSNNLGIAGLEALRDLKINTPENISVVCFDDNDLFRLGSIGMTVVSQPIERMAKKAVKVLINQINDNKNKLEHIILEANLIERESVKLKKHKAI